MTSRPRTPTGRPRGWPPLTPEQREANRVARLDENRERVARQFAGKVRKSVFLTDEQSARLDRLVETLGFAGAGALVESLILAAPDLDPPTTE